MVVALHRYSHYKVKWTSRMLFTINKYNLSSVTKPNKRVPSELILSYFFKVVSETANCKGYAPAIDGIWGREGGG